jgi:hypothetical protein
MSGYRGTGIKRGKYAHIQFGFIHDGIRHYQMFFRAGQTINCKPPIVEGHIDSIWTTREIDVDDESSVSSAAGMRVLLY